MSSAETPRSQDKVDAPKYIKGEIVRIGFGPYSLRIDEVLVTGTSMYSYRGQIFKDGRLYKYGVVSEKAIAY